MQKFWANPFYRFLSLFISLYFIWHLLYKFVLQTKTVFDQVVVDNIVSLASTFLTMLGYNLVAASGQGQYQDAIVFADLASGVAVGKECDGIVLLALFLVFIVAYPGPLKHKLWFGPLGLILVHMVNVARVVALALISHHFPQYLDFNHDYTFTLIVYGFVFGLWYLWIAKWSRK